MCGKLLPESLGYASDQLDTSRYMMNTVQITKLFQEFKIEALMTVYDEHNNPEISKL